ncbi:hypothetical protein BB561_000228 [Smittium simulii]|uniref:Major facilitator superfamily (MFS) profile domain-containing protein n=1 Tax=Smittium simulii TaxID=133385 RepID=A0A2T9YZT4_9FUNG|nr:hypothetical protein BB561_000228 [Smittium simulii]
MTFRKKISRLNCDLDSNNEVLLEDSLASSAAPSAFLLFFLTIGFFGVQVVWSVEMGYGTLYLLELNLTKTQVSLVWLAGPLSGLVMQPIIGFLSDNSTSKFGKRKPFIFFGCLAAVFSLIIIGWAKQMIFALFNSELQLLVCIIVILGFYFLDFSINAIMACLRALLIDVVPESHQVKASALVSCMIGFGSVLGYLIQSKGTKILDETIAMRAGSFGLLFHSIVSFIVSTLLLALKLDPQPNFKDDLDSTAQDNNKYIPLGNLYETSLNPSLNQNSMSNVDLHIGNNTLTDTDNDINEINSPNISFSQMYVGHNTLANTDDNINEVNSPNIPSSQMNVSNKPSLKWGFILNYIKTTFSDITKLWMFSHFIFSACMLVTYLTTHSYFWTVFSVSVAGFSWAISACAPFAIIGKCISTVNASNSEMNELDELEVDQTNYELNNKKITNSSINVNDYENKEQLVHLISNKSLEQTCDNAYEYQNNSYAKRFSKNGECSNLDKDLENIELKQVRSNRNIHPSSSKIIVNNTLKENYSQKIIKDFEDAELLNTHLKGKMDEHGFRPNKKNQSSPELNKNISTNESTHEQKILRERSSKENLPSHFNAMNIGSNIPIDGREANAESLALKNSDSTNDKYIFNIFVVIPQILTTIFIGSVYYIFDNFISEFYATNGSKSSYEIYINF